MRHNRLFFSAFSLLFLFTLSLFLLSGCGDKEPVQRKAFMHFLQERIVDPSGVVLPSLDDKEKKSFGVYAKHYKLLQDFQKKMADDTARHARELLTLADLETLDAIAQAKTSLRKATREAARLQRTVIELQEKTDAARAKLKQSEDLKVIYDKAYEKVVSQPSQTAGEAFRAIGDMFDATLELLRFIDTHNHDMEIAGQNINLRNPGLMDDLNKRMKNIQEKSTALRHAYTAMMKAMLQ